MLSDCHAHACGNLNLLSDAAAESDDDDRKETEGVASKGSTRWNSDHANTPSNLPSSHNKNPKDGQDFLGRL